MLYPELLHKIIEQLDPENVVCLALSCHWLFDIVRQKTGKLPEQICLQENGLWKNYYHV